MTKIIVATANEGRGISASNVLSDFMQIFKTLTSACRNVFVGFQEIDEADAPNEHGVLKNAVSKFKRLKIENFDGHEPQIIPANAKVLKSYRRFGMEGIPHVSPTRFFWVTEVEIGLLRKRRFAFVNTHYVAGAFNKKVEKTQRQRIDGWNVQFDNHKKLVEELLGKGLSVVWTSDVNRIHPPMPLVHPREHRVRVKGMDIVSVIEAPNGVKFEVVKTGGFNTHSDHDVQWAVLKVNKA